MECLKKCLLNYINQVLNDCKKSWDYSKNNCILTYNDETIIVTKVKQWNDLNLQKWGTDWQITLKNNHNQITLLYSCWEIDNLITSLGGNATTNILEV